MNGSPTYVREDMAPRQCVHVVSPPRLISPEYYLKGKQSLDLSQAARFIGANHSTAQSKKRRRSRIVPFQW